MSDISEFSFMNSTTARDIQRFAVMMWLIYYPFTTLLGMGICLFALFNNMISTDACLIIIAIGVTVVAAGKNFIPTNVQYILTAIIILPLIVYGASTQFEMSDAITWYYKDVKKIEAGPFDEEHDSTPGKETLVLRLKGGISNVYTIESKDFRTKVTDMDGWINGKRRAVLLPTEDFNKIMKTYTKYTRKGYTTDHAKDIVISGIFSKYSQFMQDAI